MYKIIGGDQKEYGPVTAEQLRQWIAQGRANGQTLVQAEGGPWKPLSTFPEFADSLRAPPPAGAPPPPAAQVPPLPGSAPVNSFAARQTVQAPAICLIIIGSLGALGNLFGIVAGALGPAFPFQESTGDPNIDRWVDMMSGWTGVAASVLGLVLSALVIAGGARMLKLRSYGLCIAAAIIAMLPCSVGACCCLGLPVGIWALVLLNKPEIRGAFSSVT